MMHWLYLIFMCWLIANELLIIAATELYAAILRRARATQSNRRLTWRNN